MTNILSDEYFNSVLQEYKSLNNYDLMKCINISVKEYFGAKRAFIVKDKIYIILLHNIQILEKNSIRTKQLKLLIEKNFQIINKFQELGIKQSFVRNNDVVFYAKKDLENEEFILFTIFFKKMELPNIKAIIYKDEIPEDEVFKNILTNDITPIALDVSSHQKHENIFIFKAEILNRAIILHELSLIFKEINNNLEKKISYKLTYINYKKAMITLKFNKKVSKVLLELIREKIKKKLFINFIISKERK